MIAKGDEVVTKEIVYGFKNWESIFGKKGSKAAASASARAKGIAAKSKRTVKPRTSSVARKGKRG
jgi:hypothetical protein